MRIADVWDALEESFSDGVKKGEAIGENNKALKTARKIIKDGIDIEKIIKFRDLTRKRIESHS